MAERVVLVTGSTSGIGRATALAFAALGDRVVFNSARSTDEGAALVATTPGSHYVQGNIADDDDCARIIDDVLGHFGQLDVLINNAGTTRRIDHHDLESASIDVWREIFDVNVFGTWNLSVKAMDALRQSRGCIVNVSSVAASHSGGSSIPYSASKAALNQMTMLLAKAMGPEIRVNAVAPGLIATPWTESWQRTHEFVSATAPLRRSGTPEDVAEVIVALASAAYVTGQVVTVDGGLTL